MKRLFFIFLIFGYIFWGIFLLSGLFNMVMYNGSSYKFKFDCAKPTLVQIVKDRSNFNILYSFKVNDQIYVGKSSVNDDLYSRFIKNKQITICYNKNYPSYCYIQDVNLSSRKYKSSIFISLIFILVISILGILIKRNIGSTINNKTNNQ
jgi:hypothetical protein